MTDHKKEVEERIKYQRAIYRLHDCDDPALKDHFQGIIDSYEKKHNMKKARVDKQPVLPGFRDIFDGKGLA